jgi:RHS repeat-associated protein
MEWDYADRLKSPVQTTSGRIYYNYDAGGNRVKKNIPKPGGYYNEYIYLGTFEIYRRYRLGNVMIEKHTNHIMDDTKRVALLETKTIDNGQQLTNPVTVIRYQYDNHLGSACLELDESADIISYEEYHPFGTTSYRSGRSETEVSLKRYKYVGKERDNETGLYYYGARYYAAWLCRFVSVDPLQFKYPELTPFQYASNCPVSYIDLDGLEKAPLAVHMANDSPNAPLSGLITYTYDCLTDKRWWTFGLADFAEGAIKSADIHARKSEQLDIFNPDNKVPEKVKSQYYDQTKLIANLQAFRGLQKYSNVSLAMVGFAYGFAEASTWSSILPKPKLSLNYAEIQSFKSSGSKVANRYSYRALTSANAESSSHGKGIFAKAPEGIWSLEQHLTLGSSPKSFLNDPWIATSTNESIARSFSSGNGLIRIDLTKIPETSIERGWLSLSRSSPGYHYSFWQQEVSIFGQIPQNAIKTIK